MDWTTILVAVLGSTALSAFINQAGEYIRARKKHKEDTETEGDKDIVAIKKAMKYILLDRIKHLGEGYIQDGEIDFDDRRRLNDMHDVYHSGLGGNGDLDVLMKEVNHLPLKVRE